MKLPSKLPAKLPAQLRRTLLVSAVVQKVVSCLAVYLLCLAASLVIVLATVLLDRFVECGPIVRVVGSVLSIVVAVGGVAPIVYLLARPARFYGLSIRLDQACPANEDRCGTTFDLARRLEAGQAVGHAEQVERLFADTAALPLLEQTPGVVVKRPLALAAGSLACLLGVFLLLQISNTFNLPLLFQRMRTPYANLPRDSATVIDIVEVNREPLPADTTRLPVIPSDGALRMKVRLSRRPHRLFWWIKLADPSGFAPGTMPRHRPMPQPYLEFLTDRGVERAELVRAGGLWVFSRPRLARSVAFRIRAGGALTRTYFQLVEPRIQLSAFNYSVRFPRYAHKKDIVDKPLTEERLSLLEESRLTFHITCSEPFKALDADFEVLEDKSQQAAGPQLSAKDAWQKGFQDIAHAKVKTDEKDAARAKPRRKLRVRSRRGIDATFRLDVKESGILRVRAVGRNGFASPRRVCVIELVKDSPPRVTITGVEPDTNIIPGEVVAYQYKIEDDLAVSDLIMEWDTAESAHVGDLFGEEYIRSDDFGKKIVQGQELIQRMNYYVYATAPFRFRLRAIDSKGQETVSEYYRIHIINDDFASRFEDGIQFMQYTDDMLKAYQNRLNGLGNQLNIIEKAVGNTKTWPEGQDNLLEEYVGQARRIDSYRSFMEQAMYRYGGFPYRLNRMLGLVIGGKRLLFNSSDFLATGVAMRASTDVPATIKDIRAVLARQRRMCDALRQTIAGERVRFLPEKIFQQARRLKQRLDTLETVRANRELYEGNLRFYRKEFATIAADVETVKDRVPALAAISAQLQAAANQKAVEPLRENVVRLLRILGGYSAPPSSELVALTALMHKAATEDPVERERGKAAVADVLTARGGAVLLRPFDTLGLARAWLHDAGLKAPDWYTTPTDPVDLWLALEQLDDMVQSHRRNLLAGRYHLNPAAGYDAEAEIRETALAARDMLAAAPAADRRAAEPLGRLIAAVERGDLAAQLNRPGPTPFDHLQQPAEAPALARLKALRPALVEDLGALADQMDAVAALYDGHAAETAAELKRVTAAPTDRDRVNWGLLHRRAMRLQGRVEALEVTYRTILFALMQADCHAGGVRDWSYWRTWNGIQLGMTVAGFNAYERITVRFPDMIVRADATMDWKTYGVISGNARDLAGELRAWAGLIRRCRQGRAVEYDFAPLMKRSGTVGSLDAMKAEFDELRPFLAGAATPEQTRAAREKLAAAFMGRLALNENTQAAMLTARDALKKLDPAKSAELLAIARGLHERLDPASDKRLREYIATQLRDLEALPADAEQRTAACEQVVRDLDARLDQEIVARASKLQLPPVNTLKRANLRGRQSHQFWTIAAKVANHDRRWLTRIRDAELSLVRAWTALVFPRVARLLPASDMRTTYPRLVELRARQVADERRKNRGISFLSDDGGPHLKLPRHIAEEFFRARIKRPPESFKKVNEAYYEELYKDLSN